MKKTLFIAILLTLSALLSFRVLAEPAVSKGSIIDENATTAEILKNIRNSINDAIETTQSAGNYQLLKGGTELKSIIDTWEKAHASLSDETYQELDKSQRKFFARANTAAKKLNQDAAAQKEAAASIAELANQIVVDTKIFDGRLALFRYSPRIAYPGMRKLVSFTIQGDNFNKANPRITLPNGKSASRVSLSKQEAVFSVPSSAFKFDSSRAGFAKLKFSYLNPKKKRETVDIAVLQLPLKLGDYTLQIRTRDTAQDTWEGMRQFYWSGRDEAKTQSQGPHENGWKIITSSVHQGRAWGEAGKGCFIVSNKEHGFAIEIRVGVIKTGVNANAPGYQYCEWHWKEYFERQVMNEQPPIKGEISWPKDVSLSLPENTVSMLLKVKTWGGIEREITGPQTEPFYRVEDAGDFLMIKPQVRADLNEL